jgi:HPt (histidine-containing phosphotransfer) domain-containing protein
MGEVMDDADRQAVAINWAVVDALRTQVGEADSTALYADFLKESKQVLGRLVTGGEAAEVIWRLAHDLKSTSVLLGFVEISFLARQIEMDMKNGAPKPRAAHITKLIEAFGRVDGDLRSLAGG